MATNFLAARNSNLSSFNVVSITYSTIRGSTIASVSTMNVSTIVNSNITAVGINYSTLVGSSIVNNTVITQSLGYSTLTGSSITGSALTVGNIQGTSVSASTITTTGNVGIGTVNPYGKLHVLLSNAPTVPAGNTWTSGWAVFGDNTGATPAGNGNAVGIAFNLTANASLPAGGLLYSIAPNAAWNPMNYSAANHNFSISGSLTPAMTIISNGNVGIGMTNPSSMLHVNGGITTTSDVTTQQVNALSVVTDFGLGFPRTLTPSFNGGWVSMGFNNPSGLPTTSYNTASLSLAWNYSGSGEGEIDFMNNYGNGGFNFYKRTGASSAILLTKISPTGAISCAGMTTTGNVGIGTTNPTGTLQITSTYTTSGIWPGPTLNFQLFNPGGTYWMAGAIVGYLSANAGGTAGYPGGLAFQTKNPDNVNETAPTTKMVIDSNGNVGIGTINPTYPLDVYSNTGNTGISFRNTFNGSTGDIVITHSTAAGNFIINGTNNAGMILSNGNLYLNRTSALNAALMVQKDTGNVGIGTNNPSSPLHIYANTSNILTLDSSLGPTYMSFSANGAARALIGIDNSAGEGLFGSNVAYGLGIGTLGNTPTIFVTNNAIRMTIASNGNVSISGSLSKGSGTFDIEHPLYPNTNRRLVHSFIEGPRCDLIYRGIIVLTNGSASVYIDKQCTYTPENAMDDGTFEALCVNPQYFLQNMSGFNRVIGSIYRGILTITCENNTATDTISWMVVAERKDPFVKNWDRTDSNGYLNTQYMK